MKNITNLMPKISQTIKESSLYMFIVHLMLVTPPHRYTVKLPRMAVSASSINFFSVIPRNMGSIECLDALKH